MRIEWAGRESGHNQETAPPGLSRKEVVVHCLSFFLFAAALSAQTQPAEVTTREETPTFQSRVSLVRVPVVIRDKQGHAVGNLQKQDFQLTDRGKPQYISQFALEGSAVPKPADKSAQPEMPASVTGEAPKLVAPTRFVAYVFDDLHMSQGDLDSVRAAALKHIDKGVPPRERIALLTLSGRVLLSFTDDLAKFRETLTKITPVPPPFQGVPPARLYMAEQFVMHNRDDILQVQTAITASCLELPLGVTTQQIAAATLTQVGNEGLRRANDAFRVLNTITGLLASMPGDRIMILVSPGVYVPDESEKRLNEVIDRATRAGVVVNALDARGVSTVDVSGGVPGCSKVRANITQELAKFDREEALFQGTVLDTLAASTGGTRVAQNDFVAEFDRLANPPEYIYYLGFYPKDLKPDGKFHDVKVTVGAAKGLTVTARNGYWAPSQEENAAATATREISEAVFSRDEMRDLPMEISTDFYKTTEEDAKLRVVSHLDIGQISLRKQDDRNRDDVTLVCALFDRNGNFVKGSQTVVEIRLKDDSLQRQRSRGVTVDHEFDVKTGDYLIRVVARDAEGRQMAAVNGGVEIP